MYKAPVSVQSQQIEHTEYTKKLNKLQKTLSLYYEEKYYT